MKIAHFTLNSPTALAPMAGITDNPMRRLCRQFGAGWTVGEMISGNPTLRHTFKTQHRIDFTGEASPIVVQIAGADPETIAQAAVHHVALGAEVIDINMGCPAKKVCRADSGSALMKNESLVNDILRETVQSVDVPVTLKTRLGWDDEHLNVLNIAHIAEKSGVAAIAIHGRSRTQMFRGEAKYDLIAQVKQQISIPVWVNGDIDSADKALNVLEQTGADGVMIGRAAMGRPWIFAQIAQRFSGSLKNISAEEKRDTVLQHLQWLYDFYGKEHGVKIARKHLIAYTQNLPQADDFLRSMKMITDAVEQYEMTAFFLNQTEITLR